MIEYLQKFYSLSSNLVYVLLFCFIYIPLFNRCNIKKKIKKNGKSKTISKPKSVLALTYLVLLLILFKCFTFRMVFFVIISIVIGSLCLTDRLSSKLNDSLYQYNKSAPMIFCWKLLHTIFTLINMVTEPLFNLINNKISKKLSLIKNIITNVANMDSSEDLGVNIEKEFMKLNEEISNMSDYICKTKSKYDDNDKNTKNEDKNKDNNDNKIITFDKNNESLSDININEICETNKISSSKCDMIKKIDEINNIFNKDDSIIDDMTITITEK